MKNIFSTSARLLVAAALSSALLTACDDDTAGIGSGVMPGQDVVSSSQETFTVKSRTVLSDSVLANTNNSYLGCVVDPETRAKTTCNFMAQFNVLENTIYPARNKMLTDESGKLLIDSCAIRIFISDYYGDSLQTMKLAVQELDTAKVIRENQFLYTNLSPEEYYTPGKGQHTTLSYAIKDLSRPDSITSLSRNIVVRLPEDYGRFLVEKYYENPQFYSNSYQFIHHVCPGFYFQIKGGVGSMAHARTSTLDVFFRYHTTENGKDTIVNGMQRMAATQEVIQQTMIDNTIPASMLNPENDYTYVKSPAGLFTELTLPMDEIVDGEHYNDTINAASITLTTVNTNNHTANAIGTPDQLLLVPKSMAYSFFENSRLTDDSHSFLAKFNSSYNAYTFSNISRLITNLKNERDEQANVLPGDDEATRKAKWALFEQSHPDWNKVYLIPVDVETTTSTNSYGIVSTVTLGVKNQLGMYSAMLKGGPKGLINMDVVYSRFEEK